MCILADAIAFQHATTSVPRRGGLEDVHVVYTGDNSTDQRAMFTPSFLWHSDVWATLACDTEYVTDEIY